MADDYSCYWLNGQKTTEQGFDYVPCKNYQTSFATCCSQHWSEREDLCHPSGLCIAPNGTDSWYYRGPCADRTGEKCVQICPDVKKSSWAKTEQCNSGKWCCKANDDDDCCNDGSEQFRLDMPDPTEPSATSDSDTGTPSTQATQQQPIVTVTRGPTDDGGLSNGSKGAIGGSIGGVAAIALAVVVWWILRKKRTARGGTVNGDRSPGGGYHGGSTKTEPVLSEAGGSPILESDSRPKPPVYEIGGT